MHNLLTAINAKQNNIGVICTAVSFIEKNGCKRFKQVLFLDD